MTPTATDPTHTLTLTLTETIRACRHETERTRRLAPPIVAALVEARLCRLFLDEALAGHPATPLEALELWEMLAGVEASVAWISWNSALVCGFSRFLEKTAREELFADPSWLYAQSTRPSGCAVREAGGYRISGRWSLVSGCELAEWLLLCCVDAADPGGAPRFAFVHRRDVEILDTWHSGGLRGTGSHDVVLRDVRVPGAHTLIPTAGGGELDSAIGRIPVVTYMTAGFAALALGVARSCLDAIVARARAQTDAVAAPLLRDRAVAQLEIAAHTAALDAARSHLHTRLGAVWECVRAGETPDLERLGASHAASLHADCAARGATDSMHALGGTWSLYTDSPLERAHRDLHAMLRHVVAQPAMLEDAGRVQLGLPPQSAIFAL